MIKITIYQKDKKNLNSFALLNYKYTESQRMYWKTNIFLILSSLAQFYLSMLLYKIIETFIQNMHYIKTCIDSKLGFQLHSAQSYIYTHTHVFICKARERHMKEIQTQASLVQYWNTKASAEGLALGLFPTWMAGTKLLGLPPSAFRCAHQKEARIRGGVEN